MGEVVAGRSIWQPRDCHGGAHGPVEGAVARALSGPPQRDTTSRKTTTTIESTPGQPALGGGLHTFDPMGSRGDGVWTYWNDSHPPLPSRCRREVDPDDPSLPPRSKRWVQAYGKVRAVTTRRAAAVLGELPEPAVPPLSKLGPSAKSVEVRNAPPRRPRIAGVTSAYFPSVGGIERYVYRAMASMSEWADVHVFSADANLRVQGRSPTPWDVPVSYLPTWPLFGERIVAPRWLWSALKRFAPDVVWTQHPSVTGDVAGLYARMNHLPWIATYHADLAPWTPYGRVFSRWEAAALGQSNAVMVSSERYRTKLAGRGVPEGILRVVPLCAWIGNGIPPPPCITRVQETDRPGPSHRLLFVGGLDRIRAYKRPEKLLVGVERMVRNGDSVAVTFVGDGDRRGELQAEARRLGLEDRTEVGCELSARVDELLCVRRDLRPWCGRVLRCNWLEVGRQLLRHLVVRVEGLLGPSPKIG